MYNIYDAVLRGMNDGELNDDQIYMIRDFLNFAPYIYNTEIGEINITIQHSFVCQLECCDIRLCDLFKSYVTFMLNGSVDNALADNIISREELFTFCFCVLHHIESLCMHENCPVIDCWNIRDRNKLMIEIIRDYYANENRDISKDYNNNDE
jgi:hypothetical protein